MRICPNCGKEMVVVFLDAYCSCEGDTPSPPIKSPSVKDENHLLVIAGVKFSYKPHSSYSFTYIVMNAKCKAEYRFYESGIRSIIDFFEGIKEEAYSFKKEKDKISFRADQGNTDRYYLTDEQAKKVAAFWKKFF